MLRPMLDPQKVLQAAGRYLKGHPEEVARIVRSGFGLRFGVPLAAFRWLVENLVNESKARDVEISAVPPGLKLAASLDKMQTTLRLSMVLYIHRVDVGADKLVVELRFDDVKLQAPGTEKTVLSALIRSGALDIAQLGALVNELPGLPPLIVSASANRITLDLMKSPALGKNPIARHLVGLISSLITVKGVETEAEHLDVVFRALPQGASAAVGAVENHLVTPGLSRLRAWWRGEHLPPAIPERI